MIFVWVFYHSNYLRFVFVFKAPPNLKSFRKIKYDTTNNNLHNKVLLKCCNSFRLSSIYIYEYYFLVYNCVCHKVSNFALGRMILSMVQNSGY